MGNHRNNLGFLAAILVVLTPGSNAVAASITDLGTLGGSYSYAYGINDSGQVVGGAATASGAQHAFLYSGGSMTDLGTNQFR